jgi:hypothetical protein
MLAGRDTQFDRTVLDAFLDVRAEIVEIGRRLPEEPAARASSVVLSPAS